MTNFRRTSKNKQSKNKQSKNKQSKNKQSKNKHQTRKYLGGAWSGVEEWRRGMVEKYNNYRLGDWNDRPSPLNIPDNFKNETDLYIEKTNEHLANIYYLLSRSKDELKKQSNSGPEINPKLRKEIMILEGSGAEDKLNTEFNTQFEYDKTSSAWRYLQKKLRLEGAPEEMNSNLNNSNEAYNNYIKELTNLFYYLKYPLNKIYWSSFFPKKTEQRLNYLFKSLVKAKDNLIRQLRIFKRNRENTGEKINFELRIYRIEKLTRMMENITKSKELLDLRRNRTKEKKARFMEEQNPVYKNQMKSNLYEDTGVIKVDGVELMVHASKNLQDIIFYKI
jgi:hypothetical protein